MSTTVFFLFGSNTSGSLLQPSRKRSMKKKIVIRVEMNCDRCRVKAMQVVAAAGADSVAVEGEKKDRLVLVGDSVDPADLTTTLRKKVGPASIVKVEEVKEEAKEEAKEAAKKPAKESVVWCYPSYSPYHKVVMYDHGIGGASDPGACSIL